MNSLIEQGKVLYWGTSEWPADLITQAHAIASQYGLIGPTVEQPQYNMLNRDKMEKEFLRLFRDYRMGTTIWSPLASGILTGKYMNGIPEGSRFSNPALGWLKDIYFQDGLDDLNLKLKQLTALSNDIGMTLAQLAIAWCLKNENVSSVILGATKKEQLIETMKAQELQTRLTPEIMVRIDQILANVPTPERVF